MANAVHRRWQFDATVAGLCVNRKGDWVMAALGDGTARLFPAHDETAAQPKHLAVHHGVALSLTADADDHAFLSGGDDGRVMIIDPEPGTATELATTTTPQLATGKRPPAWVDHVAASPDGAFRAYSTGKRVHVLDENGEPRFKQPLDIPSHPGGLAFSPNGKRLAVSHYNGLSLYWLNAKDSAPTTLAWKGSHLGIVWSPDGKAVLTCLQEDALHGWTLPDAKEMRMQGYAARPRSLGFTVKGRYLATSGADQIICWPFTGGGPWGKAPLTLGGTDARMVTAVAPHPKDEMVAAGYDDGMIVLAPLDGRMEIMIHPPSGEAGMTMTGLVWNSDGTALYAATLGGTVLLFTIESVRRAVVAAS